MTHQPEQPRLHVRWMLRGDLPAVLAIERESFEFAWKEDDFIRCLRQQNVIGLVVDDEANHCLVGFVLYETMTARIHVLNLAVSADFRRRGVARAVIAKLKCKLTPRRQSLWLEVRETNIAAQLCFRQLGFRAVRVLRDYYDDTSEDAYLMRYRASDAGRSFPVNRITALGDQAGER